MMSWIADRFEFTVPIDGQGRILVVVAREYDYAPMWEWSIGIQHDGNEDEESAYAEVATGRAGSEEHAKQVAERTFEAYFQTANGKASAREDLQ